ncbi:Lipoprotein NlpI [Saliniradius amylolyticus]|uniref:Lipoprotein NlpI n=1 Tax=Saliniradius amylolyticus TaxID=2183582 RepID=A0A2S2E1J6_9ALTE|nr:lipoprotein NlpI [Saliniradius amylolyticus]AWL11525.1 Lipoprotein NlpI [Saliniradius amylolyticus]
MQKLPILALLLTLLLVAGCSSVPGSSGGDSQMGNLILAEPEPADMRSQMALARYSQILNNVDLDQEQRAELLYQRGMLYDSVGLKGLAHFDFTSALKLKPDMAEAYNFMGIHHTQNMEFIRAYEAFDATLEIDPEHEYAFLNRGIALYYGGRPELAVEDLAAFYQKDTSDPYRAIWAFIAEYDIDPEQATKHLKQKRAKLEDKLWASELVDLFLGKISEGRLLGGVLQNVRNQSELTHRLCEAYFYLGKYHTLKQNKSIAANYFKLALSTNVYEFVEHKYARLELDLLRERTVEQGD